ncbi:flavodoxin [Geomonas sp. Red276]
MKSLGAATLAMPTPVWLVGTYDHDGNPNVATIAWGGICCSEPPAIAVSLRKARYTYDAIVQRKAFTVNIPAESQIKEADFAGMVSGRKVNKFEAAGLTPVRSELVDAPFVAEFPMIVECKLIQTVEIGIHIQFIGEIMDIKVRDEVVNAEGQADATLVKPVMFNPSDRNYYGIGAPIGRGFEVGKDLIK